MARNAPTPVAAPVSAARTRSGLRVRVLTR